MAHHGLPDMDTELPAPYETAEELFCMDGMETQIAYRLLHGYILCAAGGNIKPMNPVERELLKWIGNDGMALTIAELVRIRELGLRPTDEYLGAGQARRLTGALYGASEGVRYDVESLPMAMELSEHLHETVTALLSLFKHGFIYLI